jgi:thioredoxin-dependent peroxiredoxin
MNNRRTVLLTTLAASILLGNQTLAAKDRPAPETGDRAPKFKLQDQTGTWHELKQYHGKWLVLYFYPKDDTPGCTTEACEFRDNMFAFRKADAIVLGVSVDDVDSHKKFSEKHSLPFPILADADKKVSKSYGVLIPVVGIAGRQTFIIDPKGRIAKHYAKVVAKGHSDAVLADLKTLAQSGA